MAELIDNTIGVLEAIRTRRSVRKYEATPVDDKTVGLVLEAARWAPSWRNTQCWRFIVVWNLEIKAQLIETLSSDNRGLPGVETAPVVIAVCAELGKAGLAKDVFVTDKGDWFMFDVALATQNIMLAAHSLGLGTVPIGNFNAKRVAEILGVPEGIQVVALLPLGWPAEEPAAGQRKELQEFAFTDKYGEPFGGL